jgi:hypothetical protein
MIETLNHLRPVALKLHDAGDFFSRPYSEKWLRIARTCRSVQFFIFTRTWACPDLWPSILTLASLPNVAINLSLDNSMLTIPIPPGAEKCRWAWLALDDDDRPDDRPIRVIFRNRLHKLPPLDSPFLFGVRVCPAELGHGQFTCAECRHCVRQ